MPSFKKNMRCDVTTKIKISILDKKEVSDAHALFIKSFTAFFQIVNNLLVTVEITLHSASLSRLSD